MEGITSDDSKSQLRPKRKLGVENLPGELQNLIFQHFSADFEKTTLRSCRLANRAFNEIASSILYRTVHLSANELSFTRFRNIATASHLARHVKQLIFHRGTWLRFWWEGYKPRMLRQRLEYFRERYLENRGRQVIFPTPLQKQNDTFDLSLVEEIKAEVSFNAKGSAELMLDLKLPNLEEVYFPRLHDDIDSEYQIRRTGRIQNDHHGSSLDFTSIMVYASHALSLQVLDLSDVSLKELYGLNLTAGSDALSESFSRLKVLRLRLAKVTHLWHSKRPDTKPIANEIDEHAIAAFYGLLDACHSSLQELCLEISPECLREKPYNTSIMQAVMATDFPSLHHLELTNMPVDEPEFTTFLTRHNPTLRILHILSCTVTSKTPETSINNASSNLLHSTWRIPQSPTLHIVSHSGNTVLMTTPDDFAQELPREWYSQRREGTSQSPEERRCDIKFRPYWIPLLSTVRKFAGRLDNRPFARRVLNKFIAEWPTASRSSNVYCLQIH